MNFRLSILVVEIQKSFQVCLLLLFGNLYVRILSPSISHRLVVISMHPFIKIFLYPGQVEHHPNMLRIGCRFNPQSGHIQQLTNNCKIK